MAHARRADRGVGIPGDKAPRRNSINQAAESRLLLLTARGRVRQRGGASRILHGGEARGAAQTRSEVDKLRSAGVVFQWRALEQCKSIAVSAREEHKSV